MSSVEFKFFSMTKLSCSIIEKIVCKIANSFAEHTGRQRAFDCAV